MVQSIIRQTIPTGISRFGLLGINRLADVLLYWHFNMRTQSVGWEISTRPFTKNIAPKLGLMLLLSANYPIHFPSIIPSVDNGSTQTATIVNNDLLVIPTQVPKPIETNVPERKTNQPQESTKAYVGLILPIQGVYTTYFSNWHPGIDIAQAAGTPIKPIMGGKVISAGWEVGYGLCVVVDHANGYKSRYAHMSKMKTKVGDIVYQESVIGNVGTTGHSTGNHLHLEIYHNDVAINPLQIITATNRQY
jgi:murein DD-endopeptidase MepM/ murein hydrolase activator NlpD